jgi:hypothetical protein
VDRLSRGPDPVQLVIQPDGTSSFLGTNYGSRNAEPVREGCEDIGPDRFNSGNLTLMIQF